LKYRFLSTLSSTIFSQIKQEAVKKYVLREHQSKLYEKIMKQKADEISKTVIYRLKNGIETPVSAQMTAVKDVMRWPRYKLEVQLKSVKQ
jgi:hypothetical protein